MAGETITAEDLLRDIYEAEAAQRWFEQKYGLLSETFYRLYQQGLLRDEDLDEIRECMEWAGWWEIYQDRRQRYDQLIQQRLDSLTAPASLFDLHIRELPVAA
jgi:predicted hydrolase (HD superfamily)